jgi:hypothetical protein
VGAAELVFETVVHVTGVVDYGASLEAIVAGKVAPPPEGARFDASIQGSIDGPKLKGSIHGVNYLNIRADGRVELHVHAEMSLIGGERVAVFADGEGTFDAKGVLHFRERVSLRSNTHAYTWVNSVPVWAEGTADLATGEIRVREYKA